MSVRERPALSAAGVPALEVRGVRKSFAGVTVLHGVDLVVRPASVHALAGHNGSGKSTLIKTLAGFHGPDADIHGASFGKTFTLGDHAAASNVGLRFVHQELGLVDSLSTVDNLALGTGYPLRGRGLIRWGEATRRSREAMTDLGYDIDVKKPVGLLSAAERTGVAIARALQGWAGKPAVIVLDEPTAAMPAPEVGRLFEAVRRLRDSGLGIVYVTHHLDEILSLADEVTVLRNGSVALSRGVTGLTHDDLASAIVGRPLDSTPSADAGTKQVTRGRVALSVEGLSTRGVEGLSFSVAAGEIVGIAGITGSGRDEVLPAIAGALARAGTVRIGDVTVPHGRPRAAIRAGFALVPADRRNAAVFADLDTASNLTISGVRRYTRLGILSRSAEVADAREWFRQLEVSPPNPTAPILTLSGGNQQKVMVGRWLRCSPTVLALDEPTQGVDIGARQSIYQSLYKTAEAGNSVLISSSDGDELAALCDRVLVMSRGRLVAELSGSDLQGQHIDEISLDGRGMVAA